jgi:Ca2+-binding EF-hand superfamily protein
MPTIKIPPELEGLSLTSSKAPMTPDQSFSALKKEHKQTLSKSDLKKAFRLAGARLSSPDAQKLMELADSNSDQKISFKEWEKLYQLFELRRQEVAGLRTSLRNSGRGGDLRGSGSSDGASSGSGGGGGGQESTADLRKRWSDTGLSLTMSKAGLRPDEAFRRLAKGDRSYLRPQDLQAGLRLPGQAKLPSNKEMEELMRLADTDGNGKISLKEFEQFMKLLDVRRGIASLGRELGTSARS